VSAYSFVDLSCAALVVVSAIVLFARRRSGRTGVLAIFGWLGLLTSIVVAAAAHRDEVGKPAALAKWPAIRPEGGYVGSQACSACHPGQHSSWADSWHRTMTQVARPENVIAPFDGRVLGEEGASAKVFQDDDGRFMMKLDIAPFQAGQGPTGIHETLPVVMATGMHHEQQYWLQTDPDSPLLTAAPFSYLATTNQWIPRQASFIQPPPDHPLVLGTPGMWSETCIKCHATKGELNPNVVDLDSRMIGDLSPQVAELGISCEACHGPGQAHVEANQNPLTRYQAHFAGGDPTIVNPVKLDHKLGSSICGSCHSIRLFKDFEKFASWARDGFEFRPGDDLLVSTAEDLVQCSSPILTEKFKKRLTDPDMQLENWFWSDGKVRVSGREFTGMITNPCFTHGEMSCFSCHRMHQDPGDPRDAKEWATDQLDVDKHTNEACLQCHGDLKDPQVLAAHTRHDVTSAGSDCMNCHMSYTVTGLMKAMRSHAIDSPRVQTTLDTGRPNACNQCHMDESLTWAAETLHDWYGHEVPEMEPRQGELSLISDMALTGDAGARALAAWTLGWNEAQTAAGKDWAVPYLAQLLVDPYDTVRFIAYRSLKTIPGFEDLRYEFMGPADEREQARLEALAVWNRRLESGDVDTESLRNEAAILFGSDGRLDQAEFDKLLEQRDDKLLWLLE